MNPREPESSAVDDSTDELQRYYIEEYLLEAGHSWKSVRALPQADADRVLAAASEYASSKISGGRNKAAIVEMIHHG